MNQPTTTDPTETKDADASPASPATAAASNASAAQERIAVLEAQLVQQQRAHTAALEQLHATMLKHFSMMSRSSVRSF